MKNSATLLYEALSKEFIRRGIGSIDFSKLEELYHLAEQERFNITADDVISIKTALTKLGISTYEQNELSCSQILSMIRRLANRIREGIYEPLIPKYETPKQYKQRTGKEWSDDGPVWAMYKPYLSSVHWELFSFRQVKNASDNLINPNYIIIATEAGKPLLSWKPEDMKGTP
jgi:hypothetical protein